MKKNCPLLKHKVNFNQFKKKKVLQATWDESDSSSSDEEATKQANICFMAQEDEVCEFLNNDELLDAFNELFIEFKKENAKK